MPTQTTQTTQTSLDLRGEAPGGGECPRPEGHWRAGSPPGDTCHRLLPDVSGDHPLVLLTRCHPRFRLSDAYA
jgi:hypothetical protein